MATGCYESSGTQMCWALSFVFQRQTWHLSREKHLRLLPCVRSSNLRVSSDLHETVLDHPMVSSAEQQGVSGEEPQRKWSQHSGDDHQQTEIEIALEPEHKNCETLARHFVDWRSKTGCCEEVNLWKLELCSSKWTTKNSLRLVENLWQKQKFKGTRISWSFV